MITAQTAILLAITIPLLAGVLIALTGKHPNLREAVTLLASLALLLTVSSLLPAVLNGQQPILNWIEMLPGLSIRFQVEPLGMMFASVAALLWPVNSLYSIGYMRGNNEKNQTRFYICFAIAIASVMGIAFAGNLLTLFIFYEALTLSTYPLVTHSGSENAMKSGRVYLGILISTSIALLLVAIIWTWQVTGSTEFTPGGLLNGKLQGPAVGIMLLLYMYGIGKAALMPIHRWLPAAMVAPTPVSALLHAVAVVKAGVFTVVKVIVYIFGLDLLRSESSAQWLLYAAAFTIIVASVIALRQDNLKRRLAYSTVSQLAYVVLATAILAPLSVAAAALHIVAHAFGKITLFFAAGSIYTASGKTMVSQLNGIGYRMPWTMGAFAIGSLSMIGVPPAAGFISKWYLLLGAVDAQQWFAIGIIIISTLLNAAYFIPIIYAAFFKTSDAANTHGESPLPMVIALLITACLTLLMFLFPQIPLALAQQLAGVGA